MLNIQRTLSGHFSPSQIILSTKTSYIKLKRFKRGLDFSCFPNFSATKCFVVVHNLGLYKFCLLDCVRTLQMRTHVSTVVCFSNFEWCTESNRPPHINIWMHAEWFPNCSPSQVRCVLTAQYRPLPEGMEMHSSPPSTDCNLWLVVTCWFWYVFKLPGEDACWREL